MKWNITTERPVYIQLIEQLQIAIVAGEYPCGSKVPSVRELAEQAAVNPNTMQKALQEMEAKGLIITQRTAGRTITEDEQAVSAIKKQFAKQNVTDFIRTMKKMGYTKEQIIQLLKTNEEA